MTKANTLHKSKLSSYIYYQNIDFIKKLISNGTLTVNDLNTPCTKFKSMPLYDAILTKNFDLVKLLIDLGADVNKPSRVRSMGEGHIIYPLELAKLHELTEITKYIENKINENTK